jgi:hypothetical protein
VWTLPRGGGFALALPLAACAADSEIGHLTVLSTKVYDSGQTYVVLGRFRGSSHPALGGGNVEDAVEDALRQASGGIYLTNVVVKFGGFPSGFDVEGDVHGLAPPVSR